MKTCTGCGLDLNENDFWPNRRICKKCFHEKYQKKPCPKCGFIISIASKGCKKCKENLTHKVCTGCKDDLPISNFGKRYNKYRSRCKKCELEYAKEWRINNPEEYKQRKRNWSKNKPKQHKVYFIKKKLRKHCNNISEENRSSFAYEIFHKTNCEICGDFFEEKHSKHIDHCHKTNKYRGTICRSCNHTLGHSKESISRLDSCKDYLLKHLKKEQDDENKNDESFDFK